MPETIGVDELRSLETSVLKALCLTINTAGSELKYKILDSLAEDDFYFPILRAVFRTLGEMHARGDYVISSNLEEELQKIDGERQRLSRWIKRTSKSWLRVADTVGRDALDYARSTSADVVFCGHTHIPGHTERNGVRYINSGCWTDRPSQYVTVGLNGEVLLHECA